MDWPEVALESAFLSGFTLRGARFIPTAHDQRSLELSGS